MRFEEELTLVVFKVASQVSFQICCPISSYQSAFILFNGETFKAIIMPHYQYNNSSLFGFKISQFSRRSLRVSMFS